MRHKTYESRKDCTIVDSVNHFQLEREPNYLFCLHICRSPLRSRTNDRSFEIQWRWAGELCI